MTLGFWDPAQHWVSCSAGSLLLPLSLPYHLLVLSHSFRRINNKIKSFKKIGFQQVKEKGEGIPGGGTADARDWGIEQLSGY